MSLLDLPRRGYVKTPTRLEFLPRLTKALGGKVRVWLKHDDELAGAAGGNNFLYKVLGVDGVTVAKPGEDIHEALKAAGQRLLEAGRKPYLIPEGCSNPLGAVGYVGYALEIFISDV